MTDSGGRPRHLLHVFPSFTVGGSQMRFGQLVAAHGERYRHTVISLDGRLDMQARVPEGVQLTCLAWTGAKQGLWGPVSESRRKLAEIRPDMLVTYNWGSMNWCLANRWAPVSPHVHIEDGFGPEEQATQLRRRVWTRRLALTGRQTTVVVPSKRLEGIARGIWRLPERSIRYVLNGVEISRFAGASRPRVGDGLVIGTVATLRREKNLARLIRVFAMLAREMPALRLVIVGDGSERAHLEDAARQTGFSDRIRFTGASSRPEDHLAEMDVFALTSDTEQMPLSVLEAMASALPIASFDVGDVADMVAKENRAFVSARVGDEAALCDAVRRLLQSQDLRVRLGAANRAAAAARFDRSLMVARYAELFG